jgi:hypothetical protein
MRGSPFACVVTNVLRDRPWPTLSSGPLGFAFFATLKRQSQAFLLQRYLQKEQYTNFPGFYTFGGEHSLTCQMSHLGRYITIRKLGAKYHFYRARNNLFLAAQV